MKNSILAAHFLFYYELSSPSIYLIDGVARTLKIFSRLEHVHCMFRQVLYTFSSFVLLLEKQLTSHHLINTRKSALTDNIL